MLKYSRKFEITTNTIQMQLRLKYHHHNTFEPNQFAILYTSNTA